MELLLELVAGAIVAVCVTLPMVLLGSWFVMSVLNSYWAWSAALSYWQWVGLVYAAMTPVNIALFSHQAREVIG